MTRKIKITQIAPYMGEQVQALVAATTLEWEARVKKDAHSYWQLKKRLAARDQTVSWRNNQSC